MSKSLKEWMKENRYTITAFAKKLGISRNYLSQIVNNNKKPGKLLKDLIESVTEREVKI